MPNYNGPGETTPRWYYSFFADYSRGIRCTSYRRDETMRKLAKRLARKLGRTVSLALYERHGVSLVGHQACRWELTPL